jgi:hypothetical protein
MLHNLIEEMKLGLFLSKKVYYSALASLGMSSQEAGKD